MKTRHIPLILSALVLATGLRAQETFDDAMKRATADYGGRLQKAADELNTTRTRIAGEKAPLLQEMRSAEDRIVTAESEIERLETNKADSTESRRKLLSDLDAIRKNTTYVGTLAHDGLAAYTESLAPGEGQFLTDPTQAIGQKLDDSAGASGVAAMDVADYLLERTRRALGGYTAPGSSLVDGNNEVLKGTFAFVGPETFFLADQGGAAGTVRPRAGSAYPVTYVLQGWNAAEALAFFQGKSGTIVADASGGKALRLKETKGTLIEHIQKGGLVAYAIIGVGLLALIMVIQKSVDLAKLSIDSPAAIRDCLAKVASGPGSEAEKAIRAMKPAVKELYSVGLQFVSAPKEVLEEHLQSVLLRQRLHFERRLSLLSVIATAAPLMGLLGTVVGMVKTFALITVFGTGNAGKLASGISEVLIATELGLVVAIPTLIAHGFLAHRIQRNLSLLEKDALDFVTAAEASKSAGRAVSA
ncbi:MAG TPA: MotA/TolQ/ExbB proton channel family protein [Opitutaceae bacterium]|nr:MotA/TolQ/ExbB proton channel family protein [Opitutaceae bacterium]